MGLEFPFIDAKLRKFIAAQPLYFVASAPATRDGHVNVSPKGHADTFTVIDEHTVAYLDLTGSGIETIAHARENGRVTIMFCSFAGPPKILRLYGQARPVVLGDPEFDSLAEGFPAYPGARAVIVVEVTRIADACGYAVPLMHYEGERDTLERFTRNKGNAGMARYRGEENAVSIDGLPGIAESAAVADTRSR
ncbi:MAG: pyridoxamine 5'-phosphate oxidase family protein [Actinomycetota bacterium]|nr:pyridoxamine 5'-phosphate oxidase family protein [Actinomycetota bacterium]